MKNKPSSVSYGYKEIGLDQAKKSGCAWLNKRLPAGQWKIVKPIIKAKVIPEVARPVIKIVKQLKLPSPTILDVGCSSGYYLDFFNWANINIKYFGCDFSSAFVRQAKKRHPFVDFKVASMIDLPYDNNHFEILFVSGSFHCEWNYRKALKEITRVASRYVLLHRLPVFENAKRTKYFSKIGYVVKMMEIVFSESKLNELFLKNKLRQVSQSKNGKVDIEEVAYWSTILLEKI